MDVARVGLRRETLAEQVAEQLAAYIGERALQPGEALPTEAALATAFGVSRPTVREALRVLTAKGLIETTTGRGARVKPVTNELLQIFFQRAVQVRQEALIELLEVRKGVEVQSAILAARRRTAADLDALRRLVAAMRRCLDEPARYTELDAELHLAIAGAARNEMLHRLVDAIREPLKETIREGLRSRTTDTQRERVQVLHEELLAALERGSEREAGEVMGRHFDEAVMALAEGRDGRLAADK